MMILRSIAKSYKRAFYINTVYSVLNKIFDLAPPFLIGMAVDIVVKKQDSFLGKLGITDTWDQLVWVAIFTVIVWGLESFFEYLMSVGWSHLAQIVQKDIRAKAFSKTLEFDLNQVESQSSGELLSILNDDVNQLERFLNTGASSLIQLVVTISIIGSAFFYLAPNVAVYGVIPIPFIIIGSLRFQKFLEPKYKKVRDQVGILNSEFSNCIQGIQTVKSFANENFEKEKIRTYSQKYVDINLEAIKISSLFTPLIRMLILSGFLVNLLYGGYLCLNGQMEVGTYSVLVFMIQRLLWPLTSLGELLDLYQRSNASLKRIYSLINKDFHIRPGEASFPKSNYSLEIKNVSFSYQSRDPVFKNLSLTIDQDKTIGFVGGTGSGKSTLVKLLLRFYDPTEGSIKIGEHDLKSLSLKDLRENIGYVGQDIYLFHGTIRDNISYGPNKSVDEEIRQASILAEADEFIQKLPQGYDTIVGERGHKLSGGQRQRISIARALLKDPPILILDEATSSVDNETEAAIQLSLSKVKKGRTTIIIAHRLSTIVDADHIYVFENGSIADSGTHQELIQNSHIYNNLWSVQTGFRENH